MTRVCIALICVMTGCSSVNYRVAPDGTINYTQRSLGRDTESETIEIADLGYRRETLGANESNSLSTTVNSIERTLLGFFLAYYGFKTNESADQTEQNRDNQEGKTERNGQRGQVEIKRQREQTIRSNKP